MRALAPEVNLFRPVPGFPAACLAAPVRFSDKVMSFASEFATTDGKKRHCRSFCREIKPLRICLVAKQLWVRRRHVGRCFDGLAVQIGRPDASSICCFRKHANASRLWRYSYRYLETGNSFCQVGWVLRWY